MKWLVKIKRACGLLLAGLFIFLIAACSRSTEKTPLNSVPVSHTGAKPAAVLQTGGIPLWFRLTEEGPVLLESIEDAAFSAALVPWPLALHIRFMHEKDGEIILAVNRDGFIKLSPYKGEIEGVTLFRFSGGEYWRQYTIGGFVFYNNNPVSLLYLDSRFLSTASPPPLLRAWTFNMESNMPFPLEIPAMELFPADEGWEADALRYGSGDLIYYRVVKRNDARPEVLMFSTADLSQAGDEISAEVFFNSASHREEISHPLLPQLPEGFFYTGIGRVGDNLFASWEEQEDFNIGAAGFVLIK
ncbi:MAG: hypothetical protein LBI04_05300 [Treponema sp.]|jgi:hypothetical protein|nr:hypothetical protein [Treponema sp.]